jgi:peptidyl-prolyl cis-trans isomerase SurA
MPHLSPSLARFALCAALLGVLLAAPANAQRDGEVVDGVVAVVGTHPILRSDVDAVALSLTRGAPPPAEQRRAALDELISHHVIIVHAERDTTVAVLEEEVTLALEQRTEELVRQLGSEEAVEQLYNKSLAQLREDYRGDVRRQLRAQEFQRRRYFNVRITPAEVREWYRAIPTDSLPEVPELVRLAHIVRFPTLDPAARDEARGRIDAIRDSIAAGSTIEEMARRHSDDPGSRDNGGRYSAINLRDLVPEFGAVAGSIETGEVSQVFESPFGFHVLRLNARRGDVVDFNHVLIQIDQSRTDPAEALRVLRMVRDSLDAGGDFARLAKEFSEDASSSARGGNVVVPQTGDRDLRYEALGPSWRATLDGMAEGEVSQPTRVELLDGREAYHVVKLQRRVPEHTLSLDLDWPLIEEFALQEKRQRELEAWTRDLYARVYIACKDDRYCSPDIAAAGR